MSGAFKTDMQRSISLLSATRQSKISPKNYGFLEVERVPFCNDQH